MKKAKKAMKADPTTKSKAKPTLGERIARAEKLLSESCDVTYRLGQLADRQAERINGIRKTVEGLVSRRDSEVSQLYTRINQVASTSEAAICNLFLEIEALKREVELLKPKAAGPQCVDFALSEPPEPKGCVYEPGYYVAEHTGVLTIMQCYADGDCPRWMLLGTDEDITGSPEKEGYEMHFGPFSIADIHVPECK